MNDILSDPYCQAMIVAVVGLFYVLFFAPVPEVQTREDGSTYIDTGRRK